MDTASLIEHLRRSVPGATIDLLASVDMPTISVDRDHLVETFRVLRDDPLLQFAFLADVTAVDRLPAEPRFEVVYLLACLGEAYAIGTPAPARRLRVKVGVPADDPRLPTSVGLYPGANWPAREVFDLFAILFEGHP